MKLLGELLGALLWLVLALAAGQAWPAYLFWGLFIFTVGYSVYDQVSSL